MSSGLYTKNNLSESGLNAKESLQKLYGPQIQEDILLFAFASRLESTISCPDQIVGLVNEPLADSSGNTLYRTKIITNKYTYSDNNLVWFDSISPSLDKRTTLELSVGSPIKVSVSGSITSISFLEGGENYGVRTGSGQLVSLPATVNVNVRGKLSGASNAVVAVTVSSNGSISRSSTFNIVFPGSGYVNGEDLDFVLGCLEGETEAGDKCLKYTQNFLYQDVFVDGRVSSKAYLKNDRYRYTVKFADGGGFFLYDNLSSKYLYLGSYYDTFREISSPTTFTIKRKDSISSENITQLYNLNGYSAFWSYSWGYKVNTNISSGLQSLSARVSSLQQEFVNFVQNVRIQSLETDKTNVLGTRYNIIEGKNLTSNYRVIMRDPDGVLDQSSVDFYSLSSLTQPGQVSLNGNNIPGIWLWTGEKYQRAFSSDDKPFMSQNGRQYLSPAIYNLAGSELPLSGSYKYSISTGYLKPGTGVIRGFNSQISTLVQNISGTTASSGGFVYHRLLTPTTYTGSNIKGWPLFSYVQGGITKDAKILAI